MSTTTTHTSSNATALNKSLGNKGTNTFGTAGDADNIPTGAGTSVSQSQAQAQVQSGNKRNELENLIRELQTKLGSNWDKYHETLSLFLIGKLSRKELVQIVIPLLKDGLIKYHNKLLLLNFANSFKNIPTDFQNEFASFWNKKSKNKTVKSSQYEKFKQNIMGLPLKERRRIRTITRDSGKKNKINAGITLTRHGLLPKIPSIQDKEQQQLQVNNLVSWQQDVVNGINTPIATDTYELPDADDLTKRVLMIMRESGLTGGINPQVLDLIYLGLEYYLKNIVETTIDVARYREHKYNNDDFLTTAIQTVKETFDEGGSGSGVGAGSSSINEGDVDSDDEDSRDPKRRKVTLNIDDIFNSLEMFPYMTEANGPKYRLNNIMLKNDDDNDVYVSNSNPIDYELPPKTNILEPVTKINGTVEPAINKVHNDNTKGPEEIHENSKVKPDPESKSESKPQDSTDKPSQGSTTNEPGTHNNESNSNNATTDNTNTTNNTTAKPNTTTNTTKAQEKSKPSVSNSEQPPVQSRIGTADELKWLVHDLYTHM